LKEKFGLNVGLSDHTESIEIPILAIGFGCRVIEKHLTLDNNQIGPDHKASLNPHNMEKMIKNIRNMELALGDGVKQPNEEEKVTANLVRPKIICKKPIMKGEVIAESKLTTLRANDGVDARYWDSIVNKIAQRSFVAGEPID
jgi:N,N'-diacetyllegionaminate synthase